MTASLPSSTATSVFTANRSNIGYPPNWPYVVPSNSALTTAHTSFVPGNIVANSGHNILVLSDISGKQIVKIDQTGVVTWHTDILIDEAANALGRALELGAEHAAKITQTVKQRMRDTVFEEIISLAHSKGSLTADDLTYLYQAAKIMDKLKGGND